jgi:hypothetical protein
LIQNRTVIPIGLSEHMLEPLIIGLCDRFFHTFHILSVGLH